MKTYYKLEKNDGSIVLLEKGKLHYNVNSKCYCTKKFWDGNNYQQEYFKKKLETVKLILKEKTHNMYEYILCDNEGNEWYESNCSGGLKPYYEQYIEA